MRLAYADPPYIGQARKHYRKDPKCAEVDHEALIRRLETYDGWALSCSSPSLRILLPMCGEKVRVGAWVKPFASFKPGINPAYAWGPVLFVSARPGRRSLRTCMDWTMASIVSKRVFTGAKGHDFCMWLFDILGAEAGDDFHDMFPGSGAVGRAWDDFCKRPIQEGLFAK